MVNLLGVKWGRWLGAAIAVVLFACLSSSPVRASSLLNEFAALKQLAAASVTYEAASDDAKPALVEFYADWCSICRGMAPAVAQLHETYGDRVNFVMLDIDDPQTQSQVQAFGVRGVPHYAFIGAQQPETGNRDLMATLVGRHPAPALSARLDALLQSAEEL